LSKTIYTSTVLEGHCKFFLKKNGRHLAALRRPPQLTLKRWRNICRHAAATDGVAHLWCHPENFLTADGMFELFSGAMEVLAEERHRGEMTVLTQRDYARSHTASIKPGRSPSPWPGDSSIVAGAE